MATASPNQGSSSPAGDFAFRLPSQTNIARLRVHVAMFLSILGETESMFDTHLEVLDPQSLTPRRWIDAMTNA
jgi:hypothetical protein